MSRAMLGKQSGFTLIELLTVMALLSVVTSIGVTMFFRISDLWRETALRTDLGQNAQSALEIIRNDFGQTLSPERADADFAATDESYAFTSPDSPYWRQHIENDSLVFPVAIPNYVLKQRELRRIRYAVDRSGITHRLMRQVLPLHGDTEPENFSAVAVADGVIGFNVECQIDGAWVNALPLNGDAPMPPSQIRISLSLQDPDHPTEQVSRMAVFPLHVE